MFSDDFETEYVLPGSQEIEETSLETRCEGPIKKQRETVQNQTEQKIQERCREKQDTKVSIHEHEPTRKNQNPKLLSFTRGKHTQNTQ